MASGLYAEQYRSIPILTKNAQHYSYQAPAVGEWFVPAVSRVASQFDGRIPALPTHVMAGHTSYCEKMDRALPLKTKKSKAIKSWLNYYMGHIFLYRQVACGHTK